MRKHHRTIRILVAFIAAAIPVEAVADCYVTVELYNQQRRVPGNVNVECTEPHYSGKNSRGKSRYQKGFGNWGVMSYYGAAYDGFQFAGWYEEDGWLQWQSCTKKLPKPDCIAYNAYGCTGQKAVPDRERKYGSVSFFLQSRQPCATIGVLTVEEIDMHIVELDFDGPFGEEHDPVASLIYGDIDVPLTCAHAWYCTGRSDWLYASSGAGTVNSRAQVRVRTQRRGSHR